MRKIKTNENIMLRSSKFDSELCSISFNNSSQICICVLCGLPGSGKTTLLRLLTSPKNENSALFGFEFKNCSIVGIEYDAILPAYTATVNENKQLSGKWKSDRAQILSATEAVVRHIYFNRKAEISSELKPQDVQMEFWQQFSHILDVLNTERQNSRNSVLLVIDDNMYFRSMRYKYYKLARKYQTGYCQIYVTCSVETAMERNKNREQIHQVPEEIILRMLDKLEPPDPEKFLWETNSITVSSEGDIKIDLVHNLILKAIMNPVQPLEESNEGERLKSRVECSANVLHQADLILRKCVAKKIAELKDHVKPENLKSVSRQVSQVKEQILHDLKDGHITLVLSKDLFITNSAEDPNSEFFRHIEDIFLKEMTTS